MVWFLSCFRFQRGSGGQSLWLTQARNLIFVRCLRVVRSLVFQQRKLGA